MQASQRSESTGMNRRDLLKALGLSLAAGMVPAGGSAAPAGAPTPQQPEVRTKVIPRTDQIVPAIGLGTFLTFDLVPGQPRDDLWEVMRRYFAAGGRVIDTSPLYGTAEISVGDFLSARANRLTCSWRTKCGRRASIWLMTVTQREACSNRCDGFGATEST
jgi:Aldo/keto reductase family